MILIRVQSPRGSRTVLAAACLFSLLGTSTGIRAAVINDVWLGGNSNWNNPANWSAGVPNDGGGNTYNVSIDGGNAFASHVGLDISVGISGLTIDANDQLTINDNRGLTLNGATPTITNNGVLALNSGGNFTDLNFGGTSLTLAGTGTISLDNSSVNRIYSSSGSGTLINASNTIQGSGSLGFGQTTIINQAAGIINANQPGALNLSSGAGGVTNQGLLEATNGATLTLQSSTITNTGGTILASGAGSAVNLAGATIVNGTLNTNTGGVIQTVGAGGSLDTVTNNGALQVSDNTRLGIQNTITNNATIALNSGGNITDLAINSGFTATLTGGGTVNLNNFGVNRIYATSGLAADTFTNVNNLIQGAGQIGVAQTAIINQAAGVIDANLSSGIVLNSGAGGVTNQGLLEATSGSILTLQNSTFTNTGGTILASGAGSAVNLSGATIVNGVLNTNTGGVIQTVAGNGTIDTVTNNGTVQVNDNTNLTLHNTITNNGTIALNSGGNFTDVLIDGAPVTLAGGGTVTLGNSTANRIYSAAGTGTLINSDNTIQGAGQIGIGQTTITNQAAGTIIANQSNPLTISAGSGGFTNNGTLRATAGSTLNVTGPFTNFNSGANTLTGGTYQVLNGTFKFDNANIVTNAARVVLDGASSQIVNQSSVDALSAFANNTAAGSFTIQNGRNLTTAAPFTNAGAMFVGTGSTLTTPGSYNQTGGATTLNTTFADSSAKLTATTVNLSGGTLTGNGTINGNVANTGGAVNPGLGAGKIQINGTYGQSSGGSLNIDLGGHAQGSQYDLLSISNTATLGGTLNVDLINGFFPSNGDIFQVMTYSGFSGTFSTINGLNLGNGLTLIPVYNPGDFELRAQGSSVAATPEPSSIAFLVTGLGVLGLYRRRKAKAVRG